MEEPGCRYFVFSKTQPFNEKKIAIALACFISATAFNYHRDGYFFI
jgi:hypothetical protein